MFNFERLDTWRKSIDFADLVIWLLSTINCPPSTI
jgi:hypothetical protein